MLRSGDRISKEPLRLNDISRSIVGDTREDAALSVVSVQKIVPPILKCLFVIIPSRLVITNREMPLCQIHKCLQLEIMRMPMEEKQTSDTVLLFCVGSLESVSAIFVSSASLANAFSVMIETTTATLATTVGEL
jgi:hypothetical protein